MKEIFPNLRLPVIASPMFLISGPQLVIECCKNNIIGTFPSVNQRTTDGFENWLIEIETALEKYNNENEKAAAPFGVNLVVHKTNPRWKEDLKIVVKHKVPLVITSLGAATEVVDAIHSYGGLIFHDVTNPYHAQKAAAANVDGIIAVSGGAGGHAGSTNPFALIGEIRSFFKKTIILGGALSTGQDIAAAMQMGADLAYMGTRFINVKESQASDDYQQMIIDCNSMQIVYTPSITGVKANFLMPSLEQAGYDVKQLVNPTEVNYGEKLTPAKEGSKAWVDTWSAGHGCGVIQDVPSTAELVERLEKEFKEAIESHYRKFGS